MLSRPLPPELFYSYALPDILSDHLHRILVESEIPAWNPFYTLPLVSKDFRSACQTLCINIFGLVPGEGGSAILHVLNIAKRVWRQANRPPDRAMPVDDHTVKQLMSSGSLIQVYICAGLAKSYLNLDVFYPLTLEQKWINGELNDAEDEEVVPYDVVLGSSPTGFRSRRFKMRDDQMHRAFLPLTCAVRLCDCIRPERVAYIAASYLASIVPLYTTAPVILKCTQDLESYVTREHRLEMETWIEYTNQTLDLLMRIEKLVKDTQRKGKLVKAFTSSSTVPLEVLRDTNVLRVLDEVVTADWGCYSEEIAESATFVKQKLLQSHASHGA